ncbi:hypothetical protein H5410_061896 [Solanum commersonii]|uniref:Uncharacterized protein n=1 Tax=Solanum commersonii TaxID=4109 RepID=A0A9J5W9A4_SOLCO|nr:hypothetical protein H5410_061896 [Solanum commersonii]
MEFSYLFSTRPIINEKISVNSTNLKKNFAFVFLAFFLFGTEKIVQAIRPYESLTTKGSAHRFVLGGPDPRQSPDHPQAIPIKSNKIIYTNLTL